MASPLARGPLLMRGDPIQSFHTSLRHGTMRICRPSQVAIGALENPPEDKAGCM